MLKKIYAQVFGVLALVSSMAVSGIASAADSPVLDQVLQSGELRVGMTGSMQSTHSINGAASSAAVNSSHESEHCGYEMHRSSPLIGHPGSASQALSSMP